MLLTILTALWLLTIFIATDFKISTGATYSGERKLTNILDDLEDCLHHRHQIVHLLDHVEIHLVEVVHNYFVWLEHHILLVHHNPEVDILAADRMAVVDNHLHTVDLDRIVVEVDNHLVDIDCTRRMDPTWLKTGEELLKRSEADEELMNVRFGIIK